MAAAKKLDASAARRRINTAAAVKEAKTPSRPSANTPVKTLNNKSINQVTSKLNKSVTDSIAKKSVKVVPAKKATPNTGLETRGNKITQQSQKSAANKIEQDYRNKSMNSFARGNEPVNGRGPSAKTIAKNAPVARAMNKPDVVKVNSNPVRTSRLSGRGGGSLGGGSGSGRFGQIK